MRAEILRILTVSGALRILTSPVLAHHFFPRESDTPVSITGTVRKFEMVNPHSRVLLDVRDPTGNVTTWSIELGSVPALINRGWSRDTLKPGDVITVDTILFRGRSNLGSARDVELPTGERLFGGSHAGDYRRR